MGIKMEEVKADIMLQYFICYFLNANKMKKTAPTDRGKMGLA